MLERRLATLLLLIFVSGCATYNDKDTGVCEPGVGSLDGECVNQQVAQYLKKMRVEKIVSLGNASTPMTQS